MSRVPPFCAAAAMGFGQNQGSEALAKHLAQNIERAWREAGHRVRCTATPVTHFKGTLWVMETNTLNGLPLVEHPAIRVAA